MYSTIIKRAITILLKTNFFWLCAGNIQRIVIITILLHTIFFKFCIYSSHSTGNNDFFFILHSLQQGTIFIFSEYPPRESGIT